MDTTFFCGKKHLFDAKIFGHRKIRRHKTIWKIHIFMTKIILDTKLFGHNISLDTRFFVHNKFGHNIFQRKQNFRLQFFQTKNYFDTKFCLTIFLPTTIVFIQNLLRLNILFLIKYPTYQPDTMLLNSNINATTS